MLILALAALASAASAAPVSMGAMPVPPDGAAASLVLPARAGDGGWQTPNRDIPDAEAVWHLRSALNVAALACRDAGGDAAVADYNAMLRDEAVPLAAADRATQAVFRGRHGAGWQDAHDRAMTRVYNFFAQPPVHQEFCATAEQVLAEARTLAPADFGGFARTALSRIEAPFLAFYARYDAYRVALADWRRGGQGAVALTVATAAPAPVASAVIERVAPPPVVPTLAARQVASLFRGPLCDE